MTNKNKIRQCCQLVPTVGLGLHYHPCLFKAVWSNARVNGTAGFTIPQRWKSEARNAKPSGLLIGKRRRSFGESKALKSCGLSRYAFGLAGGRALDMQQRWVSPEKRCLRNA